MRLRMLKLNSIDFLMAECVENLLYPPDWISVRTLRPRCSGDRGEEDRPVNYHLFVIGPSGDITHFYILFEGVPIP